LSDFVSAVKDSDVVELNVDLGHLSTVVSPIHNHFTCFNLELLGDPHRPLPSSQRHSLQQK
ncbi:MAG: hypothetical protein OWR62_16845, partial [Sulfobacillus thermotolerans]|nr:hypothetical protein [Sulfobacillus thermotolerans]